MLRFVNSKTIFHCLAIFSTELCSCKTNNYMLMRKKVYLLLSAVCLVSALFAFNAYAGIEDAGDITLPEGDLDSVNRCRCKNDRCYGGNAISLRAACAKSNEPLNCADYDGNCP